MLQRLTSARMTALSRSWHGFSVLKSFELFADRLAKWVSTGNITWLPFPSWPCSQQTTQEAAYVSKRAALPGFGF
jgi:hypothetical protein